MEEITSVNNNLIKEVSKLKQKKYRAETKTFLLEGFKAIQEAYEAKIELKQVFVNKERIDDYNFIKEKITAVNEAVLKKISTTDSAPEAVAIGVEREYNINILKNAKKVALFENIRDLGNLGTILRSAAAFSIDAIVLYGETVDLYNPKCVRASVGNLWKIPVVQIKSFEQLKEQFKNFKRIATLPKSDDVTNLKDFTPEFPLLMMFGAEADGLSKELIDFSTQKLTIESDKQVESLNLSISAGIIFYQLFLL